MDWWPLIHEPEIGDQWLDPLVIFGRRRRLDVLRSDNLHPNNTGHTGVLVNVKGKTYVGIDLAARL